MFFRSGAKNFCKGGNPAFVSEEMSIRPKRNTGGTCRAVGLLCFIPQVQAAPKKVPFAPAVFPAGEQRE